MLSVLFVLALQASPCTYDRAAMLALPEPAFDQDPAGGWRPLVDRGCVAEAADLIRAWRMAHRSQVSRPWLSFWHEGQARALAGQTAAEDQIGWNLYVDGSIAFLKRDRPAFETTFRRLTAQPGSANAEVLEGFRRC